MKPSEYIRLTLREFNMMVEGYERKNTEEWRRVRFLGYCVSKPYFDKKYTNMSVFEFMPLHGDPTKEEIEEMKMRDDEKKKEEFKREARAAIEKAKQNRLIKESN